MTNNIVFIFFVLISQFSLSESTSSELFCDASKVQNKDWTVDAKGYQQENYNKIFPIWLSKAKKGDPKYQFYTAKAYYFGKGVDKDLNKAVYWYKKSSKQGYPIAKNNLALMYEAGEVVDKNTDKAFKLICDAAIQGVLVAQNNITSKYIAEENERFFVWANVAANNGSDYGKKVLAKSYVIGTGVDQDFKKAKDIYLDLYSSSKSNETQADAAINVAHYYNVQNSNKEAIKWYLMASKLGSVEAKYNIGSILKSAGDYKEAFKWFEISSNEGSVDAVQALGVMYRNGWGVEKDLEKSVALAKKAESLGSVAAIYNLAMAYDKGEGVQQDKIKAFNLFLKSAKKGEKISELMIGRKYFKGDGVDVNLNKSAFWLYKYYKNQSKFPYRNLLANIYFVNNNKGLPDIENLSKDFIFNELLPILDGEELSVVAYELDAMGNIEDAVPLFEMAAKKGDKASMNYLGTLFSFSFHPEYKDKYYDIEKAIYWLDKTSDNSILSNLTLARIYFGMNNFSEIDLEKAYKYASRANQLLDSGLADDYWQYKDNPDILEGLYENAVVQFSEQGMHEIAEGLIRKSLKRSDRYGLFSDDLARKMHLANLAKNPEEFENVYLDVVNNTNNITSEEGLFNVAIALGKLSTIYIAQGNYQKSIDILVNNSNKVVGKEIDLTPALMIMISFIYLDRGDIDKAKAYLDKAKDLINYIQGEFNEIIKNDLKGRANLIEGIVDAMNSKNIDNAYVKIKKGVDQIFKDQSSSKGLTLANVMIKNFIQIGRFNYAYETSEPIVQAYKSNFNKRLFSGIKISRQEKDSIKNVLSNFIYVAEITDKTELDFGFETMQLAAGLDASDALVKTIYKRKIGLDNASIIDKLENLRLKKKITIREKLSKITLDDSEILDVDSKLNAIDREIDAAKKEITNQGLNDNSINLFISSAQDVIDTLHKQDALLTMLVSKERTFVWLLTSNGVYRHHANVGSNTIETDVEKLLYSLDPNKKISFKFPLESSSRLYDLLIRPFEQELKGINRLVISPDSVLSGIPFSILNDTQGTSTSKNVTYITPSSVRGIAGTYANISTSNANKDNWLINRFAISIVPSIYSYIESEKLSNTRPNAKDSFIGIGNPVLTGTTEQVSKNKLLAYTNTRGSISNFLSEMMPLPETEKELSLIANSFSKADLLLGKNATEKKLKVLDLSQYGVVSFATHALVSDEIESVVEPSLVLTPVDENPDNDGLLTASEISNLKLDADIVLLSACNTASAFGESNSQGLSGLANSFFNAGAKSLLVSYWSVISESAVDMTTRIFKPSNEGRSYAHKHRNAVLDLLQNSKDTYKLHPSYWAPFSVIGVN